MRFHKFLSRQMLRAWLLLTLWPILPDFTATFPALSAQSRSAEDLVREGRELLEQERYLQALAKFEEAAARDPETSHLHYYRGLAHWRLRELDRAQEAFQTALRLDPGDVRSEYYLGEIDLLRGNLESAVRRFHHVIENQTPDVMDAYQQLGRAYLKMSHSQKAIEFLEKAVEISPDDPRVRDGLAAAYRLAGLDEKAKAELDTAGQLREKNLEGAQLIQLARRYLESSDIDKAEEVRRRALERSKSEELIALGTIFGQAQLYNSALELFERALGLDANSFEAAFNLGYTHFRLQQYEAAEKFLGRAAQIQPESFESQFLLGMARTHLNHNLPAIRAFQQAVKIRPGVARIRNLLALELIKGRYYTEAIRVLSETIKMDDSDRSAWFLLIQAYHLNQDYEKAVGTAEGALERFPDDIRARYEMGFQLTKMGKFQKAQPYFKRTLELDPNHVPAHYWLGDLALKDGNMDNAMSYFRRVLSLDDTFLDAYTGLAKALLFQKQYDEVTTLMKRAASLDPDDPQPHLHLARAYRALGRQNEAQEETQVFDRLNQARMKLRDQEVERELPPPVN